MSTVLLGSFNPEITYFNYLPTSKLRSFDSFTSQELERRPIRAT
jgi:hypothetical protein